MANVSEAGAREAADASTLLRGAPPQQVLRWATDEFGADVTMACSFGGPTGMVLVDMAARMGVDLSIFYLDTDYLFPETHRLIDVAKRRYGIEPKALRSRWTVDQQAEAFGASLWNSDPDLCCALRKVEPNGRALEGKRAWIAGLRRDQSASRKRTAVVEWDTKFELLKINPLVDWAEEQVWGYITEHDVPYNALHDQGYPSIGCSNCTRPVNKGEDSRSGRWAGFDKTECGLHVAGLNPTAESPLVVGVQQ